MTAASRPEPGTGSSGARRRWLRLIVGVLALVALWFLGSRLLRMGDIWQTLLNLHPVHLVPILLLALVYYVLKALRWHYYLRVAGIQVALPRSMAAYLAGQWFTFTPAGELMRVYLLGAGRQFALVAPTVVMQVLVDFASLALFATAVVGFYPSLVPVVLPVTLPLLLTLGLLSVPALRRYATTWQLLRRFTEGRGRRVTGQFGRLLAPWPVAAGLLIGVPTVLAGAMTLYVAGLALEIGGWGPLRVTVVYAMTQLLGGVSPLPQGLGVAEGSGTLLLGFLGVEPEAALAAMLLSRGAVLGFSVLLGLIAILVLRLTVPELAHLPVTGVSESETGDGEPATAAGTG